MSTIHGRRRVEISADPDTPSRYSRHPGVHVALDKLYRGEPVTDDEYELIRDLLDETDRHSVEIGSDTTAAMPQSRTTEPLIPGHGTIRGGRRLAQRCAEVADDHFRPAQDRIVSSLGIGTYRGACDAEASSAYVRAISTGLAGGINLIDTSLNYRGERSERAVGAAIRRYIEIEGGARDEVVVCSKGGFLVPGALPARGLQAEDVVGSMHSLAPAFLADQIERSRQNLGLGTIDVYYLHNPEVQRAFIDSATLRQTMAEAFEYLERVVDEGLISFYGIATWDGFFTGALSLPELVDVARRVAGADNHFRFLQLPFSMGMREAATQIVADGEALLEFAAASGMSVIASSSLWHGRLARGLPTHLAEIFGELRTDAQRAVQYTRSTPGITAALVGMGNPAHVRENLVVSSARVLTEQQRQQLVARL